MVQDDDDRPVITGPIKTVIFRTGAPGRVRLFHAGDRGAGSRFLFEALGKPPVDGTPAVLAGTDLFLKIRTIAPAGGFRSV